VVLSNLEHHSNIVPWQLVCEATGAVLKVIPINDAGELLMDEYRKLLAGHEKVAEAEEGLGLLALRAGALAYVLKEAADAELVEAVRRAASGGTYLNPALGARLAAMPEQSSGPPDDLSEREVEVLRLIALGHTNAEIGEQLFLSVRTVETHRSHLQQKLGRSSRAELVRYALTKKETS